MPLVPLSRTLFLTGLLSGLLACHLNAADEWPQFRGPDGQGHSDAKGLPVTWSETENVKWKTELPGLGHSSPVISGTEVWMTTATDAGKSLRAICADLATGKLIKDFEVFHIDEPLHIHAMNSYASPSPIIEAGRLYVHFGTNGTACLSTETGEIFWKRQDLKIDHKEGPGSSPALWHNNLIFPNDGDEAQYVIALNKQTGETVWKTDRTYKEGKPDPIHWAFSTPLIVNVNGVDQAVVPGPYRTIAYAPDTGKELWCVDYKCYSATARPIYGNGFFYVCTGNGAPTLMAVRPDGTGDITEKSVPWSTNKDAPVMASPVLVGNRLFAVQDETGQAYCLDATTGQELWREKMAGKFSASLFAADGRVYFFDRRGLTTVIEASDTFKVLAKNQLGDPKAQKGFMASAAVDGKALILRTRTHLYRIEQ